MKIKPKKARKKPQRLSDHIEVIREQIPANETEALLEHVNHFLMSYKDNTALPETSLRTPEEARKALVVLEETQARIQSQINTARALKQALQNAKDIPEQ